MGENLNKKPEDFNKTFKSFFEDDDKKTPLKGEKVKLFPCSHRRQHLIKIKKEVTLQYYCKDSKIIYQLGKPIKTTPVSVYDCQNCEVPEAENRINCEFLGFEKLISQGLLTTKFYCGKNKKLLLSPAEECAKCKNVRYFA